MATRKLQPPPPPEPKRVYCSDCCNCTRDTSGPSYNIYTHEYFMGVCGKGLTPDNMRKVFVNKPRICTEHQPL